MDDLKSKIINITSAISKTSSSLVKNTKLNLDLANEEEKLKSIYCDIGKKVHEIYSYGGSLGEVFDERYKQIIEAENNINNLKEKINIVKGVKTCVKCFKQVDKKNEFCPYCGSSMINAPDYTGNPIIANPTNENIIDVPNMEPISNNGYEINDIPAIENKNIEVAEDKKICASCGGINDINNRFCLGCGRTIN